MNSRISVESDQVVSLVEFEKAVELAAMALMWSRGRGEVVWILLRCGVQVEVDHQGRNSNQNG